MLSRRVPFERWSVLSHVALAALLLIAIALGGWWRLQVDHADLFALQNQQKSLQAQMVGLPGPVAVQANFAQSLPDLGRVDDVARDIGQFAKDLGVQVVSMAIDSQAPSPAEWGRVQFNVSAQAQYKNTKTWLAELLGRYPALGIQSVSIRAHPTDSTRQEVRVAMVLYVKD